MTIDGAAIPADRRLSGVMILHGFTATLDSVSTLFEPVASTGLTLVTPLLRGHGKQSPEELRGVTWSDWLEDAEQAMKASAGEHGKLIVIGHSMGALLALQLAARCPELVDSIILATPAIRLASLLGPGRPLHFLTPLLSMLVDRWDLGPCFADPEHAVVPRQYSWAPTGTIMSMFDLVHATVSLLHLVRQPALIIHGRHESIVLPESADIVMQGISTPYDEKSVFWLEKSDHQIFCDCERAAAVSAVTEFIERRMNAALQGGPE
jgi:carboxylesterase